MLGLETENSSKTPELPIDNEEFSDLSKTVYITENSTKTPELPDENEKLSDLSETEYIKNDVVGYFAHTRNKFFGVIGYHKKSKI